MPKSLVILDDFITAHKNLQVSWQVWRKASKTPRNASDEVKRCGELMEMLARETRIWILSKLADLGPLPSGLVPPSAKSSFGQELHFLRGLRTHPSLCKLADSSPDASYSFVQLKKVEDLVRDYLRDPDYTVDRFKREFDALERDASRPWLDTLNDFVPFRNIDSHGTAQLNGEGVSTNVTARLQHVAPAVAQAMRERIEWMMLQAAEHLGRYELRSREDVEKDRDYSVRKLLTRKALDVSTADYWYVRYDDESDERNAIELFPRLESDRQVESAVVGAPELPESAMFLSAKNGRFLPLIGPAFGSPDHANSPGATEVVERARTVVGDDRYKALAGFLARLVSDRLSLDIDILDLTAGPSGTCDTLRTTLVGELASLASQATVAFGRSLSKRGTALTEKGEVLDDDDVEPLMNRIRQVRDFVKSLYNDRTMSEGDRTDLGVDAIADGLHVLGADEVSDKRLSVTSVTWLGDLVWHALRWDASLYPDSQALNLQLSLGMGASTVRGGAVFARTLASSGTALSIGASELEEYLASWSRRRETRAKNAARTSKGRAWQDPYDVIAKALDLCLKMRYPNANPTSSDHEGTEDSECRLEAGNAVFVVDATFDQRMCEALKMIGAKYAVIYPIDILDKDSIKHPAWAMRRFPRPAKADLEYSILWDDCGRTIDWQDVPRILIIKPYGAPLEPTEPLEKAVLRAQEELRNFPVDVDRRGKFYSITRRFLFDDVSILKDMVQKQDSMPPGFRNAVHNHAERPFELFFLGYAIEEHGRRARIVADVRPA
ncbi:MAG TPA: hypothetical protein VIV65_07295, partial [Gemmatimonadaceae bacterium]